MTSTAYRTFVQKPEWRRRHDNRRARLPFKFISFDQSIRPSSYGEYRFQFSGDSLFLNRTVRRSISALLSHTKFTALFGGVNELMRERLRRASEELSRLLVNAYVPCMTGHGEFPFEQYKHHPQNILRCGAKLYKVRAQFVARSYTSDNRPEKGSRGLSMK